MWHSSMPRCRHRQSPVPGDRPCRPVSCSPGSASGGGGPGMRQARCSGTPHTTGHHSLQGRTHVSCPRHTRRAWAHLLFPSLFFLLPLLLPLLLLTSQPCHVAALYVPPEEVERYLAMGEAKGVGTPAVHPGEADHAEMVSARRGEFSQAPVRGRVKDLFGDEFFIRARAGKKGKTKTAGGGGDGRVEDSSLRPQKGGATASPLFLNCKACQGLKGPTVVAELGRFTGVTWQGWGTSLAWYANFVGGLPRKQLDSILDMLFSFSKGLGFNIVRYNIPGGLDPRRSPRLARLPFQAVQGFRPGGKGSAYNWNADWKQRRALWGALQRGVNVVEAISYSPPAWMLYTGDVCGRPGGKPNLRPEYFEAFADYLADVVQHYKRAWNIRFKGLSPVNEPLAHWWTGNNGSFWQEGCGFSLGGVKKIVRLTRAALDRRGLHSTDIIGIDDWAAKTQRALSESAGLRTSIPRLNFHGYRMPSRIGYYTNDSTLDLEQLNKARKAWGKEIWQSEWGPLMPTNPLASDLELALLQARSIVQIINVAGASAWLYWQPLAPSNNYWPPSYSRNYGLIRLNYGYDLPFNPTRTRQYYVQLHFSKGFPAGTRFLTLPDSIARSVLAGYHPQRRWLTIAAVNQQTVATSLRIGKVRGLRFRNLQGRQVRTVIFRTSDTERYKVVFNGYLGTSLDDFPVVRLAPLSVTTIVMAYVRVF